MNSRTRRSDPLAPIEFVVTFALALAALFALALSVSWMFGGHPRVGGLGSERPCLAIPNLAMGSGDGTSSMLRPGMTLGDLAPSLVCGPMTSLERSLVTLPVLAEWAWVLGFLLVLRLVLRRTRRTGLFTEELSTALHHLGSYLLLGWLAVAAIRALAQGVVVSRVLVDFSLLQGMLANLTWDWGVLFGGFGLLTVARILRETVPMREELEATV